MIKTVISVENVEKTFKKKVVLNQINFKVYRGDFFGILGPNGAGKTVLLHALMGLVLPEQGSIKIFGQDLKKGGANLRKKINFASAYGNLYSKSTLIDNLNMYADLYSVVNKEKKINQALKLLSLEKVANDRLLEVFSDGMRAKSLIAKALITQPEILFLDEPLVSLDVQSQQSLSKRLAYLNRHLKVTIIFTSHDPDFIKKYCNRFLVLNEGRIIKYTRT